jgi:hypothetical protein
VICHINPRCCNNHPCCWSSSRSYDSRLSYYTVLSTCKMLVLRPTPFENNRLRPWYEVKMAEKSSRVSHTSSQIVWTCCLFASTSRNPWN